MPADPTPAPRSLSPWWALLLLPIALSIGWFVGAVPGPASPVAKPVPAPTGPPAIAGAPASIAPARGGSPSGLPGWDSAPAAERAAGAAPAPVATAVPEGERPRAEVSDWTTIEQAMTESQRTGKPIMIDFNADWCGPCQALKHQVFEDADRGEAVRTAVIPVSVVDRAREEGNNPPGIDYLQKRFGVDAFPTLVVFSPQSGRSVKTKGFGDADDAVRWITQAARSVQ